MVWPPLFRIAVAGSLFFYCARGFGCARVDAATGDGFVRAIGFGAKRPRRRARRWHSMSSPPNSFSPQSKLSDARMFSLLISTLSFAGPAARLAAAPATRMATPVMQGYGLAVRDRYDMDYYGGGGAATAGMAWLGMGSYKATTAATACAATVAVAATTTTTAATACAVATAATRLRHAAAVSDSPSFILSSRSLVCCVLPSDALLSLFL